jgi:DNA-binding Xre family transcriptional regulator
MMSLATAIKQVIEVRGLTSGEVTRRLGKGRDYTTFFRLLNGRTTDPRVITLVRLCVALETNPSELLELAGVWSPDTPGQATPDDLRLRVAFGQVRALPMPMQHRAVPLVEALATGWLTDEDDEEERLNADAGPADSPAAAGEA